MKRWAIVAGPSGTETQSLTTNHSTEQIPSGACPGAELFSVGTVSQIQIEIAEPDLQKLRKEDREFVRATVQQDGVRYLSVAVHLKGSVGSFRPLDDKPALTLDFAYFNSSQRFHGLRRIHLNNSVEDPSYCNERLGGELFRAAGIPAPRSGWATVTLNQRKLGLYVLKEGFTEDFLACNFKTVGGDLFEPGEGHDVNQHLKRTSLQTEKSGRASLKQLATAALERDPSKRWQKLQSSLEVDRFIRFMALEVMLCHRDGYSLARNNFRLYQNLDTGKMVFLPHGMDQLFGIPELPWIPSMAGIVARTIIETPEGRERYVQSFKNLFEALYKPEVLTNQVNLATAPLRPFVTETDFSKIQEAGTSLCQRIIERHRFLQAHLNLPPLSSLAFKDGFARLDGWVKSNEPASGQMEETSGPEGIASLHISTRIQSDASWHTKAFLEPGRYRFEGRALVEGVKPLGYGAHQGAGLRIAGQPRQSQDLVGTSAWQVLAARFQIEGAAREIEFICELRASAGDVWFDRDSLRLVSEP